MELDTYPTERISLDLSNGYIVQVDVISTGRSDVGFNRKAFKEVTEILGGIVDEISATLHRAMPTKAAVKFGIDIGIESGQLTAAIVKGSGKANLEITLEWDRTATIPNS